MSPAIEELISRARAVHGEFTFFDQAGAGSAAAALRTSKGDVFTGICIDLPCGIGFCAEHSAVAEMLKTRQTKIEMIVCVGDGDSILAPCGRCRELISLIDPGNAETQVVIQTGLVVPLKELLPSAVEWRR